MEKEMAIHSSTIAWKIPWMEEPGRYAAVHGVAKNHTRLSDFTFTFFQNSILSVLKDLNPSWALHLQIN